MARAQLAANTAAQHSRTTQHNRTGQDKPESLLVRLKLKIPKLHGVICRPGDEALLHPEETTGTPSANAFAKIWQS